MPFDCRHETSDESNEQDEEEYPRRRHGGEEREVRYETTGQKGRQCPFQSRYIHSIRVRTECHDR